MRSKAVEDPTPRAAPVTIATRMVSGLGVRVEVVVEMHQVKVQLLTFNVEG